MLIEFKVSNYRSIGEEQILSLVPAPKQREFRDNILRRGKYDVLNAIAIYGANASGKSNLLNAIRKMDEIIHLSARSSSTTKLPYDPFLLRKGWEKKPTKFEMTFIIDEDRYRYGFEFLENRIVTEWLFRKSISREVNLFLREEDIIDTSSGFKGRRKILEAAIEATRDNALFLSTCDMFNVEEAKRIFQWLQHFNITDGLNTGREELITTISLLDSNKKFKELISDYLLQLNLGFTGFDISTKDFDASDLPDDLPEMAKKSLVEKLTGSKGYNVFTRHKLYSPKGKELEQEISWELDERESAGTKKAFELSGPITWALSNGGVLIVDEIEAKMHPIMTLSIINIFLNKESNPKNAQIIFATHDTNLLSYSNLRRDQIYFAEKNNWESTEIYSLSDFVYLSDVKAEKTSVSEKELSDTDKETNMNMLRENTEKSAEKERPDTDKEKRYFEGRYGAIPTIGNFNPLKITDNGKKR